MDNTTTNKRGGSRPGSGRKPKPPGEKRVKTAITLRPDHYAATAGDRSGIIERALDNMFGWLERAKTTTTSTIEVTTGSKTNEPMPWPSS